MIFVPNTSHDPAINLAIETYLLKEKRMDDTILLFYINEPSIIIGRNQNTLEEINADYIDAHHIHVIRRLSGGGAVYHDLGNLNFSFIMPSTDDFMDFKTLTAPIIEALHHMGATSATLSGRNDLLIDGKKFSGNAMYQTNSRMFCHGTLLFNSQLDVVNDALRVKKEKIESKGIKSVRSRVTNILPYLDQTYQQMTTEDFEQALLQQLFHTTNVKDIPMYILTDDDWVQIHRIADETYRNWDWNYGHSPASTIQHSQRFDFGSVDVRLNVDKGIIQQLTFYGDFFGAQDISLLAHQLEGVPYTKEALRIALERINLTPYFGPMTHEEMLALLI